MAYRQPMVCADYERLLLVALLCAGCTSESGSELTEASDDSLCTPVDDRLAQDHAQCLEAGGQAEDRPNNCVLKWLEQDDESLFEACMRSGGRLQSETFPFNPPGNGVCALHYPKRGCPCGSGDCPLSEPCGLLAPCPEGYWCDFPDDSCGMGEPMGRCRSSPAYRPDAWAPVCACDGNVAESEGNARHAGHDVDARGGCMAAVGYQQCAARLCVHDEWCSLRGNVGTCEPRQECDACECLSVPEDCSCEEDQVARITVRCAAEEASE